MQTESFSTSPLTEVVPTYVYGQYADDQNIQSFFAGVNTEGQGYIDWFYQTALSVYTSSAINGPLLDWIGQGIYGISRPSVSTLNSRSYGAYNTIAYSSLSYNTRKKTNSGTSQLASDDIYKRVLTWYVYLGDGRQMSIQWLRRRVARFLFGVNGSDVSANTFQQVSISRPPTGCSGAFGSAAYNTQAYNTLKSRKTLAARSLTIGIPPGDVSEAFQALVNEGYLALPFQVRFTVSIAYPAFYLNETFVLDESTLS
jgi:hypothetical protein